MLFRISPRLLFTFIWVRLVLLPTLSRVMSDPTTDFTVMYSVCLTDLAVPFCMVILVTVFTQNLVAVIGQMLFAMAVEASLLRILRGCLLYTSDAADE